MSAPKMLASLLAGLALALLASCSAASTTAMQQQITQAQNSLKLQAAQDQVALQQNLTPQQRAAAKAAEAKLTPKQRQAQQEARAKLIQLLRSNPTLAAAIAHQ